MGMPSENERLAREFKVQIPIALHFELHRHRLLTGQSFSDTVEEALRPYLDREVPGEPPRP